MRLIRLTRKDTPDAKTKLFRELKEAHANKNNATLLKVSDGEEEVEAVIVPYHTAFSTLFNAIAKSKGTTKLDFQWSDHELEAQIGLGVMQVNFRQDSNVLLVDTKKKGRIIFAIVPKGFYDSHR